MRDQDEVVCPPSRQGFEARTQLAPAMLDGVLTDLLNALAVILLVEQNIHVAEALAEQISIILVERTVYESNAQEFLEDIELLQKYLGI